MKNVLMGAVAVGVAYLVYCQYKKSKGKCSCSGSSTASTPAKASEASIAAGDNPEVKSDTPIAAALSANGVDGFGKSFI